MSVENALEKLTEASRLLAEAKTFDDFKRIRDIASLAAAYAKAAGLGLEMQNNAAEVKITAERKAGEILRKMPKMDGGDAARKHLDSTAQSSLPSYEELGIEPTKAMRWQKESLVPEKDFRAYVTAAREAQQEITSKAVYEMAVRAEKGKGKGLFERPRLAMTKSEAFDNLYYASYIHTIREIAGGKLNAEGLAEAIDYLLTAEGREDILGERINLSLGDEWVAGGCKTTPLHEVIISMLDRQWNGSNDE